MPNMRILAQAVLRYRVDKVFMAESKKGHNFAIQGLTEKIYVFAYFFVLMLHIKFQVPSSSGSIVLQPTTLIYW